MFTIGPHTRSPYDAHRDSDTTRIPDAGLEFSLDPETKELARKAMEVHKARIKQTNDADELSVAGFKFL